MGGDAGWRAAQTGKPVIAFAPTWYQSLPNVFRLADGLPIADARPADGFSVFHPTPFTTWNISILNAAEALSLDQLTHVELTLVGNWSPNLTSESARG